MVYFHIRYRWIENSYMVRECVFVSVCVHVLCCVSDYESNRAWNNESNMTLSWTHCLRSLPPLYWHVDAFMRQTERESACERVYVFGCDILLLSSLPGSARGRAVGHRHHFGHVGLSTGLLSYRQHSLHCRYGKELTYSKHLHSNTKIWLKNSSKSHSSLSDIFRTYSFLL